VAAFGQFTHRVAKDFAVAPGADPDFFEETRGEGSENGGDAAKIQRGEGGNGIRRPAESLLLFFSSICQR